MFLFIFYDLCNFKARKIQLKENCISYFLNSCNSDKLQVPEWKMQFLYPINPPYIISVHHLFPCNSAPIVFLRFYYYYRLTLEVFHPTGFISELIFHLLKSPGRRWAQKTTHRKRNALGTHGRLIYRRSRSRTVHQPM